MTKAEQPAPPTELELESAERSLKDGLLRLYYMKQKLYAEGAAHIPGLADELIRLERRSEELLALWASLRREKVVAATERLLSASADRANLAEAVLERLRTELDLRSAERKLERELGGL